MDKLVKAIEAQKPAKGGGVKSWWRWPLIIVLVLIGVLVAAWVIGRDRRELAKLRHERNKRRIESGNAHAEAQAAKSEEIVDRALGKVIRAQSEINRLDNEIAKGEAAHAKRKLEIDKITWADLPRADTDRDE